MGVPLAIAGIAGTAISAAGQLSSGMAAGEAAGYKAQVAANNAETLKKNARMDMQAGEVAAVNRGLKTRAALGNAKATQGASGIDVNSGSAADVRAGAEEIGMLDALTVRSDAAKRAYGDLVGAQSQEEQGNLYTMEGEQAEKAGIIGAAGTLLSGASTVGGNFAKWQGKFGGGATAVGDTSSMSLAEQLQAGMIPM